MENLLPSLIVIALTGIIIALIFYLVGRAKKQNQARLLSLAESKGWRYEPFQERLSSGYRLSTGDWQLEAEIAAHGPDVESHLSNLAKTTSLRSELISLPGRNLLIGPTTAGVNLGSMGEMLQRKILEKYLGTSGSSMQTFTIGSSDFHQTYMLMANSTEDAQRFCGVPVQSLLLQLAKHKPVVKITPKGMEITLDGFYADKTEDIEALVKLGEYFIRAARS